MSKTKNVFAVFVYTRKRSEENFQNTNSASTYYQDFSKKEQKTLIFLHLVGNEERNDRSVRDNRGLGFEKFFLMKSAVQIFF